MNEEQTIPLEEIGKIGKVRIYNQAYVDKQQKRIAELEKENKELKNRNAELKGMYAHSAREAETYKQFLELKENETLKFNLDYAKAVMRDLLDNSNEYARARAEDFIKGE